MLTLLKEAQGYYYDVYGKSFGYDAGRELVEDAIERLKYKVRLFPATDAALVVHGRWMELEGFYGNYIICSICKDLWDRNDREGLENTFNYCSNCGAKMDLPAMTETTRFMKERTNDKARAIISG